VDELHTVFPSSDARNNGDWATPSVELVWDAPAVISVWEKVRNEKGNGMHNHRVRLFGWCSSPTVFLSHIILDPASSSSQVTVFFSHTIPAPASSSSLPNIGTRSRQPFLPASILVRLILFCSS